MVKPLRNVLPRECEIKLYDHDSQDNPKLVEKTSPPITRSNATAVTDEWSLPQWFNPLNPEAFDLTDWKERPISAR
jgi:hypothetical protein